MWLCPDTHAVSTVCHTHNRMPTSSLPNSTPYEALYGKKPDVSLFRVFGSLAYVHIKKDKRSGLSAHMEKAIFVGYPAQFKGWEFFNPVSKKVLVSDRADLYETVFLGLSPRLPDPPAFPPPPTPSTSPRPPPPAFTGDFDEQ